MVILRVTTILYPMRNYVLLSLVLLMAACHGPDQPMPLTLKPSSFDALSGWKNDDMRPAAHALSRSCVRIARKAPEDKFGSMQAAGQYADWHHVCALLKGLDLADTQAVRTFFETEFSPFLVAAGTDDTGIFTGYYEPHLSGDWEQGDTYQTPLHARPDDLVMVNLGAFRPHLKGERIAGRVVDSRLKPYEDRQAIVDGKWPHKDQVIAWVDSPVDAFFLQIQGSGIVEMKDGSRVRVGYAGQNGHPYYAIGRALIEEGALTKETVSMQSIRAWLENNPARADEIMNRNPSYVFFRLLKGEGPIGGEGVALTAGRSLAVDRTLIPYGAPLWLETIAPAGKGEDPVLFHRLMIAQDTGGAIRGPVRGDVFWGHGSEAEWAAGHMNAEGRYWILLPRTLYKGHETNSAS